MGKRGANCLDDPSLIEIKTVTSCRRTMPVSSCSNAALTLLALKQESLTPGSSTSSVTGYGSAESSCPQSNQPTMSDDRRRSSLSMCSSVTDDDRSIAEDDGACDASFFTSPRSGHSLVQMALVRPKLRLVAVKESVVASVPSLLIPLWNAPPQGRPLSPPGRLPSGLVNASEPPSMIGTKSY